LLRIIGDGYFPHKALSFTPSPSLGMNSGQMGGNKNRHKSCPVEQITYLLAFQNQAYQQSIQEVVRSHVKRMSGAITFFHTLILD